MKPSGNKRKINQTDEDVIPGTPQDKHKKKQRKKSTKTMDSDGVVVTNVIVSENLVVKDPVIDNNFHDLLNDIDFLDDFNIETLSVGRGSVDLSVWRRCVVTSVHRNDFDVLLTVREENTENEIDFRLQGSWINTYVTINDVISVIAKWSEKFNCFCVDDQFGYVVTAPDYLVSGTSVVGSLFCRRKGVLAERFTGIDCNNKIMAIGSIVHELFQITLKRQLTKFDEIMSICDEMLQSHQMMYTMYETMMTPADVRTEMVKFVQKIAEFVATYITQEGKKIEKDNFAGKIERIDDIEENIWIPKLGLKGKVDVSVQVKKGNSRSSMPLEIKTGKPSFSMEHRGQLMLYQMMMSELEGKPINSGLLLYLREGVMKEVNINRNEQRGLIMLRNEVASHIANTDLTDKIKKNMKITLTDRETFAVPVLPEPINHHSACSNCPYNLICGSFLSRDESIVLPDTHPLKELHQQTPQLTSDHIDYFIKWNGLLALEEEQMSNENQLKYLWLRTPEQRATYGQSIIDLVLSDDVVEVEDRYLHTFKRKSGGDLVSDHTLTGLNTGEYLRVSTLKRIAIAAGRVIGITKTTIKMSLERDLTKRYKDESFILDRNDSQTFTKFNLATIGALLDDRDSTRRLRSIIIDRMPPTFSKTLPKIIATDGKRVLQKLNIIQQEAVLKALTVNEYLLLKGLPGTGKTQTIAAIVCLLVMMGKSVLITSHTHSAVDNVLLRLLKENLTFLRLADPSRVPDDIKNYCECVLTVDCKTPEDLSRVYETYNIVGVTCLGSAHPLLVHRTFDVCIVDEATQVFQSTVIRPLISANKFILVGDPEQLPPIVKSKEAKKLGADESLFHRLDSSQATVVLSLQYRMNKTIAKLANSLTYKGALKCANNAVASATMKTTQKATTNEKWISKSISTHIDQSVILLNTGNVFTQSEKLAKSLEKPFTHPATNDVTKSDTEKVKSRIYSNYCEAGVVLKLVDSLIQTGVLGSSIGVIATFTSQVNVLKKLMDNFETGIPENQRGIEVNTVDQYQGRDKSVIIYSCTKFDNPDTKTEAIANDKEILQDFRRLTVAITRSQHKLIIVGDVNSLNVYGPFKALFSHLSGMSKLDLVDGKQDFSWQRIMADLVNLVNKENV
ncbi:DNA replication ATP-dependent helicase/nuclease DNA2 [Bradysia coprophila]|uniref:DNA replication ATP-dependent helicase/nuclease DNA2 n=1 Tax=Bradysia coprophila TaxID=38358 RepID=UPI00187D7D55|nr:DNA replication ATP-dependent helicase/nuclease DNA2 [Bradysia coprophila]